MKIAGGGSATGSSVKSVAVRKSARRSRATGTGRSPEGISWALDGDVLVLRIPLGRVAQRAAALQVLAAIKRELGR